jgi:hypothetical protein
VGLIESGRRHVLDARLKKADTAWLPGHADQIAHLRVLRANKQWPSTWKQPHPHFITPQGGIQAYATLNSELG